MLVGTLDGLYMDVFESTDGREATILEIIFWIEFKSGSALKIELGYTNQF